MSTKLSITQDDVQEIIHQAYGRGFLMGCVCSIIAIGALFALYKVIVPKPDYTMTQEQADHALSLGEISEPTPYVYAEESEPIAKPSTVPQDQHQAVYQSPIPQPTPTPRPQPTREELQDDLDNEDRDEYRSACIELSNFLQTGYSDIKDGYWASCVAMRVRTISSRLNRGGDNREWAREAQDLLEQYQ